MKFQVGDKVVVKHTNEEGEVIDIINQKMVLLEVQGVKFPAYIDQLEFPYFKRFSEKKLFPEPKQKQYVDSLKKEKEPEKKVADGVWMTFIPVFETDEFGDDITQALKIHLVNRTGDAYLFNYRVYYFGKSGFELENTVHAFEDFYVHDIPFANLNDSPVFSLDFSLLKADKKKADHYEASIKLKPKQIFSRIEELKQKGEATFSYKLFDQYPDKGIDDAPHIDVPHSGPRPYDASAARQHLEPPRNEIDLHIEKLDPAHESLGAFEKFTLQLRTFEKYLDLAIAHHQPSLIVIHGVGTGRLRDEIHEILRLRHEVKTFVNQYHPAYGYGATEIYFQY